MALMLVKASNRGRPVSELAEVYRITPGRTPAILSCTDGRIGFIQAITAGPNPGDLTIVWTIGTATKPNRTIFEADNWWFENLEFDFGHTLHPEQNNASGSTKRYTLRPGAITITPARTVTSAEETRCTQWHFDHRELSLLLFKAVDQNECALNAIVELLLGDLDERPRARQGSGKHVLPDLRKISADNH
jgi:hypothetical protein